MNFLNIEFDWCNIHDCYTWINNINNAFYNISSLELYNYNNIKVQVKTGFIPWKVLVLLWYHLDLLNLKNKNITLHWAPNFINFITKCWLCDFIENQEINYDKLKESVVIPFCKVSSIEELELHFLKLMDRKHFDIDVENVIMRFLWELHNNSINHWNTNKIYIMGQYYPVIWKYDISIYDDWNWIKTTDIDFINSIYNKFIKKEFKEYIEKKFWFKVFFIIICVCTRFSTKWVGIWWLWLYQLSEFLYNKWAYLNIATWKEFIKLKFNKICDILDNDSIDLEYNKLDNEIKWTYISFTFSI